VSTVFEGVKTPLKTLFSGVGWFWLNDYRMLNGVHAYGRRWRPYGNVNYPEEIEKMRQMTRLRDERIWSLARGEKNPAPVADHTTRPLSPIETNFRKPIEFLNREQALKRFTLREGFKIELFASEAEFPDLKSPVQISFDNQGRLWVAVIPSYPHYKPGGERPNDKLLILEDTDHDGRADRQTVFADGLNLPIGFELAPEGVYLSQEPHLCLLVDDDKDGRADRMERLLTGFDTHDTHHAISAYAADASGAFYLCEGRFLHSQVETPYGPQRMTDGGVWRFNPKNWRLERYSQADYNNPWAIAFDEWDQCFISDASSGQNWWGLPVSAKIPHGLEIPKVGEFAPKRARPTSGSEFVSSRHFPADIQGHFLINNTIGFLGTSLHDVWDEGSGFSGRHIGDLLSSSDPNFRPVDIEFAPDGSLYIVDWQNPLIGHMQHSARDPNRDSTHGRIYRVTYPARPLVQPAQIAGASIDALLENLKQPEYRTRYRTRRELRGHPAAQVLPAVRRWASSLDPADPGHDRHLCEALWATWSQNQVDATILEQCLAAKTYQARAAAVHVLRYAHREIPNSTDLLMQAANDPHPRVRLEAIVSASWMDNPEGARIALETLHHPFDRWMGPVFDMVMKTTLSDDVKALESSGNLNLASNPNARDYLDGKLTFAVGDTSDEKKSYGPTGELGKAETAAYALGREVFLRDGHCSTCHQPNGQGMKGIYPPLTTNPWLTGNDERLIKFVLKGLWGSFEIGNQLFDPAKGVPPMPGFGFLNNEEVAAVLNYIRNSFGNETPFITPEQVARVREQIRDRQDFYTVEEIMTEHPIPGWEKWAKGAPTVERFE
jgi:mono/diheme cytochrome c family protein/glucose/arabinose dehydrogenase